MSYKAEEDSLFRAKVEEMNAAIEGTILNTLTGVPLGRLLSLRQDFSSAFNRLLHSPADTPVKIEVSDKYLPIFLRSQPLQVTKAVLVIKHAPGQSIAGFQLALDNTVVSSFVPDPALGNLRSANVAASFAGGMIGVRTLTLKAAGDLAPTPVPGDVSALDAGKLLDIVLYLEFQAQ